MTRVLAIDGSPTGPGRTRTVLDALLSGAEAAGADVAAIELSGDGAVDIAVATCEEFDAFVLGAPAYRASFAAPLKAFLDALPRGFWGETEQPITARAVAIVMTGSTFHHYLGLNDLRSVLAGFFGAHVLTPGLYVPSEGFAESKQLLEKYSLLAAAQGAALIDLSKAIDASETLRAIRPQA